MLMVEDSSMVIFVVLFLFLYLGLFLMLFSFIIADYILTAIAVSKMCKKLSIPNGYLAFVPFANSYKLGELADACYSRARGIKSNYAKKLLKLHIFLCALSGVFSILWFVLRLASDLSFDSSQTFTVISVIVTLLVSIATIVFSVIQLVNLCKSYYGIYSCFVPKFSVMFLLFSIFLGVPGIYLLISSYKEPAICPGEQLQQES